VDVRKARPPRRRTSGKPRAMPGHAVDRASGHWSQGEGALRRLAAEELAETLERLLVLRRQAGEEWAREDRRFQAAEKAFLAWRLGVRAAALAALLLSGRPLDLLEEMSRAAPGVGFAGDELSVYVTTRTAPRLVRLLAESSLVPEEVRGVARRLREVKDAAYRLHTFFYEGDPGAAGFGSLEELEEAFREVIDAAVHAAGVLAGLARGVHRAGRGLVPA